MLGLLLGIDALVAWFGASYYAASYDATGTTGVVDGLGLAAIAALAFVVAWSLFQQRRPSRGMAGGLIASTVTAAMFTPSDLAPGALCVLVALVLGVALLAPQTPDPDPDPDQTPTAQSGGLARPSLLEAGSTLLLWCGGGCLLAALASLADALSGGVEASVSGDIVATLIYVALAATLLAAAGLWLRQRSAIAPIAMSTITLHVVAVALTIGGNALSWALLALHIAAMVMLLVPTSVRAHAGEPPLPGIDALTAAVARAGTATTGQARALAAGFDLRPATTPQQQGGTPTPTHWGAAAAPSTPNTTHSPTPPTPATAAPTPPTTPPPSTSPPATRAPLPKTADPSTRAQQPTSPPDSNAPRPIPSNSTPADSNPVGTQPQARSGWAIGFSVAGRLFRLINGAATVTSGIVIAILAGHDPIGDHTDTWIMIGGIGWSLYGLYIAFGRGSYWVSSIFTYLIPIALIAYPHILH